MSVSTPFSLLERLRGPTDQEAWSRFVRLYTPLFFTWSRRMGFTAEEASDRVQDVFLLLAKEMPSFVHNRKDHFRGWLWTVFRNRCHEHRRQSAKTNGRSLPIELDQLAVSDNVAEWVESEYQDHLVRRAAQLIRAEFPAAYWQAFWECAVRGRPPAEVAAELGVSVDVVYQAKSRILRRLRQDLEGLLD